MAEGKTADEKTDLGGMLSYALKGMTVECYEERGFLRGEDETFDGDFWEDELVNTVERLGLNASTTFFRAYKKVLAAGMDNEDMPDLDELLRSAKLDKGTLDRCRVYFDRVHEYAWDAEEQSEAEEAHRDLMQKPEPHVTQPPRRRRYEGGEL